MIAEIPNAVSFSISLPREMIKEIDILRNDTSRSRYIYRLIKNSIGDNNKEKASPDSTSQGTNQSVALKQCLGDLNNGH
jgi:metal-responsive CopG/Arc/MetJ family transcriptional regulator